MAVIVIIHSSFCNSYVLKYIYFELNLFYASTLVIKYIVHTVLFYF